MVQSCQNSNSAKSDGDEIYVWSVQKVWRTVRLSNQMGESAQRRKLRPETRMRRMRASLAHVASAQHDQLWVTFIQVFITQTQPRHNSWTHVLDYNVRPFNQSISEFESRAV